MQCLHDEFVFTSTNFLDNVGYPTVCGRMNVRCAHCKNLGCPFHDVKWKSYGNKKVCRKCNETYIFKIFGYKNERN